MHISHSPQSQIGIAFGAPGTYGQIWTAGEAIGLAKWGLGTGLL